MAQRTSKYPPKTLVNLQKVEIFAATYVDGQQYSDTRLVAKIGKNLHFLHPEGTDAKLRQPAGWLIKAVMEKLGPSDVEPAALPQDEVDLPAETVS